MPRNVARRVSAAELRSGLARWSVAAARLRAALTRPNAADAAFARHLPSGRAEKPARKRGRQVHFEGLGARELPLFVRTAGRERKSRAPELSSEQDWRAETLKASLRHDNFDLRTFC